MMNTDKIKDATSESRIQDSYEAIKTSILNGEDPDEIGERIGWMAFEEEMQEYIKNHKEEK